MKAHFIQGTIVRYLFAIGLFLKKIHKYLPSDIHFVWFNLFYFFVKKKYVYNVLPSCFAREHNCLKFTVFIDLECTFYFVFFGKRHTLVYMKKGTNASPETQTYANLENQCCCSYCYKF